MTQDFFYNIRCLNKHPHTCFLIYSCFYFCSWILIMWLLHQKVNDFLLFNEHHLITFQNIVAIHISFRNIRECFCLRYNAQHGMSSIFLSFVDKDNNGTSTMILHCCFNWFYLAILGVGIFLTFVGHLLFLFLNSCPQPFACFSFSYWFIGALCVLEIIMLCWSHITRIQGISSCRYKYTLIFMISVLFCLA